MRKIKFRAYLKQEDGKFREINPFKFIHINHEGELYSDKDIVISQFTGLLDKNGKEIFEGHILRNEIVIDSFTHDVEPLVTYEILTIEWDRCGYFIKDGDLLGQYDELEIIGNIYENPELLTH